MWVYSFNGGGKVWTNLLSGFSFQEETDPFYNCRIMKGIGHSGRIEFRHIHKDADESVLENILGHMNHLLWQADREIPEIYHEATRHDIEARHFEYCPEMAFEAYKEGMHLPRYLEHLSDQEEEAALQDEE